MMPKVHRSDFSHEIADHEATFCKSCDAPADGDGPYCGSCDAYWTQDGHLLSEAIEEEFYNV